MKIRQFFQNVQCRLHWSSAWAFALFAEWWCSRIGAALKCESLQKILHKTPTAEARLLAFTIFTAIRKHNGQPYLPRAMHFGALKCLSITGGRCWVSIFSNRRQSLSTVRSCISSRRQPVVANVEYWLTVLVATAYCLCLWIVVILYLRLRKYQYFPPNWLIFPPKLGSSGYITLGIPFILWLPMVQSYLDVYYTLKF